MINLKEKIQRHKNFLLYSRRDILTIGIEIKTTQNLSIPVYVRVNWLKTYDSIRKHYDKS